MLQIRCLVVLRLLKVSTVGALERLGALLVVRSTMLLRSTLVCNSMSFVADLMHTWLPNGRMEVLEQFCICGGAGENIPVDW